MSRWEPNARGRLEQAALALYRERGFEQVTVAEIAGRAGLTERTFFRHYADKREVLFAGSAALQELLVRGVAEAPADASPIAAVVAALAAAGEQFDARRDLARQRQVVIETNQELLERELVKLATLAEALAGALRGRGVAAPAADLAGQVGIALLRVAFVRWAADADDRRLETHVRAAFAELRDELR
ncbi:TetR family transcriptional regulator [Dactylosporangium sucinum]|uniref:TetR family transcriptional regulator n=1 Tax=Dactylosporangium sucinum TaxID=1424081 RepID=A0A917X080_9ACTN|nr:TetR family transcriptional regulator [Dactylosporangium sucinum]GGM48027.1 TetR family transcriptional regulator [Dactylosporangium sucinum]